MKFKSGNRKTIQMSWLYAIVFVLSFIGIVSIITFAKSNEEELHSLSFDWSIDEFDDQDIYICANQASDWEDGYHVGIQYDMALVNNSKRPISNWTVSVKIDEGCQIGSGWNGFWTIEQDKLSFEPGALIAYVEPGSQKTFGLVIYSTELLEMNEISLEYYENRPLSDYSLYWLFTSLALLSVIAFVITETVNLKIKSYAKTHAAYKDLVSESLRTIANIIDTKDEYTKGHSVRVAIYSRMIAERMGLNDYEQERIYYIGLLHDIGKVGIPASILTKPGRLNDEEFEIIKRHPAMGSQIMKDFSSIPGVQNGIRYHHERYDGRGYNEGLKGEEIPLEGRIICVADSYDAMSSRRCYRNALSYDFILDELKRNAGTQFDPDILKHMVAMVEEGYAPISDAEMEDYEI